MKLNEWRKELHTSAVPVLGWMYGGRFLQMSPLAMVRFFRDHLTKSTEQREKDEQERIAKLFNGCTIVCPTEDAEGEFHEHVLSPAEWAALVNANIRVDASEAEAHDVFRWFDQHVAHD